MIPRILHEEAWCSTGERPDTLERLVKVTARWKAAACERDDLIDQALDEGFSERAIGAAAGISGPAVHQRKAAAASNQERQR